MAQPGSVPGIQFLERAVSGNELLQRGAAGLAGSAAAPLQFGLQGPRVGVDLLDQVEPVQDRVQGPVRFEPRARGGSSGAGIQGLKPASPRLHLLPGTPRLDRYVNM